MIGCLLHVQPPVHYTAQVKRLLNTYLTQRELWHILP